MRDISLSLCYNEYMESKIIKTCFIGHRNIVENEKIINKLTTIIENQILNSCTNFLIGSHGRFDSLSLYVCKKLKAKYPYINIEVIFTNLNFLKKDRDGFAISELYRDIKTLIYEIEGTHYKNRITLSNKKMIDECETLICYVDEKIKKSGAKKAMLYAQKKGLKIINIFNDFI